MFEGLNGMLKSVSSLTKQIEKIKEMPRNVEQDVRSEIEQDLPSFGKVLQQKKTESGTDLGSVINRVSDSEGIDSDLVRAVIETESNFNQSARSEDGALGMMQLMPGTAAEMGVNPENPRENIEGGVKYLGKMMDRYDSLEEALAAYNAGPGAVDEYDGVPPFDETQNYVKKVLSTFRQLKQAGS